MQLEHVAVIVEDYDSAIEFFTGSLGFELVDDSLAETNDGRPISECRSSRTALICTVPADAPLGSFAG
jgi:catechol 2,3-dioxygenase-like lactoylglutathione lyase family enzyme